MTAVTRVSKPLATATSTMVPASSDEEDRVMSELRRQFPQRPLLRHVHVWVGPVRSWPGRVGG